MQTKKLNFRFITGILFLVLAINMASAVIVDADYVTLFPGEDGKISINIENNENFDIEDISISLVLEDVPFTSAGSSVRDINDIDEDDDDSVTFTLRPSTEIVPGDYSIPYRIDYVNSANTSQNFSKEGSFGIRISAKTDLDFTIETSEAAVLGSEGQISLEIINQGLGEIRSVSVQILPGSFELLSKDKIFVGTIDADDSDTASFDVVYKGLNPVFSAKITYKDFDNNDQTKTVNLPVKVYTEEQALELGLISKSKTLTYFIVILVLFVIWYVWRRIRKRRKQKERELNRK
mgnify:FL=1